MLYTELDVVNDCLGTLGELPLNSLDDEHDLVPAARKSLRVVNTREQAKGWWFNKELVELKPDTNTGHITLPGDTLRIDPTDEGLNYVQRGRKLYQPFASAAADKYKFDRSVKCWLVRLVPFDDLPPMAQAFVACSAVLDFQADYDADAAKVQQVMAERQEAYVTLNAEHIRNVNANRLRSASVQAVMRRIGPQRFYRG